VRRALQSTETSAAGTIRQVENTLAKWHVNDQLREKFIRGLDAAGIETP
jgi:hypothetical protein